MMVTIYDDEVIEVLCNEVTIPIGDSTLNALLGKGICQYRMTPRYIVWETQTAIRQ